MKHLMLDFETLDTDPTATALSLGAVLFDENGIIDKRYWKFNVQSQLDSGRTVSADTFAWWMRQSAEAQKVLQPSSDDVEVGFLFFFLSDFLERYDVDISNLCVWSNGANFDVPILEDIIGGQGKLWEFYNVWCFRTFNYLTGCKKLVQRQGTHHNALDDAIYQTNCVLAVWNQTKTG